MKNASGHHRDEDRWPLPVLAVPRGPREITWHVGVLAALVTPLVLPGGWYVLAVMAGLTWLVQLPSSLLFGIALRYMAAALVIAAVFATPMDLPVAIMHDFAWNRASQISVPLTFTLDLIFELSIAACSVATLIAFDRRSVNRSAVDLRVWQRQQTRRRQLLRRWHRSRTIPEVSS